MAAASRNRPLARYAARFYCRLRYGRARAHAEDWWPALRLSGPGADGQAGEIVHRGRAVAPLLPFPGLAEGMDELLVVGSGPSLAAQDTARIPLEAALLLNGAVHLLDGAGRRPFGVVVEDERFVWRHWRMLEERVAPGTACYFSTGTIRALCETAPQWLAGQKVHHLDFLHRPYGAPRPQAEELRGLPFLRWSDDGAAAISLDPRLGLMPAGSVAVSAAQLALWLSPPRIGFAGVDLTGTGQPRFYEKAGDTAMSRLDAAREKILAAFGLIADESSRRGIVMENYSPVSSLKEAGIPYVARLEEGEGRV